MIGLALCALIGPPCHTSTRHVRAIDFDAQGRVLISTTGGRLVVGRDDHVAKWTESGGLPNHDLPAAKPASFTGDLPPSPGTHVVGEVNDLVLLYGDRCLWRRGGAQWKPGPTLPAGVDDATLLKGQGADLWMGTRRHGAWRLREGRWTSFLGTNEPGDHNAQAMLEFKDELWVSTLEDGLQILGPAGWRTVATPAISTQAPRELIGFQNCIWVRHGDGQIDQWDGSAWLKNSLWSILPRKQATRISSDGNRVAVGQWGGWSEFDGREWSHRFPPELTGVPVTAIVIDGDRRWIGTQGKGLFRFDARAIRYGVTQGLPDDWVTAIHVEGQTVTVGTFVGGVATLFDGRFHVVPGTPGSTITGLGSDLIVSGRGIRRSGESAWQAPSEAQCFATYQGKLWIGSRRGIYHR